MVNNAFGYNTDPDLNTTIGAGGIDIDENCAAANINNAIRTIMANIRDLLDDIGGANTSGGTATVQTLTTSGTLTALADGTILTWISGFDAGAGATLNVDTLGAKALLNNDGSAIAANDFALGQPMCAIYDASADSGSGAWLLVNISQKQIDAIVSSISSLTGSDIANTPAGNIVATDVQAAINELDGQDTTILAAIAALGSDDITDDSLIGGSTVTDAIETLVARFSGFILSGCELSNNTTDATNDIDIAAGYVVADDGSSIMQVPAITKRLDAAWAVGTGNGGLDTGAIANDTYHLYAIQRSDTGVVDVLFTTTYGSPTMPTNYDRKAYVGSILRESAAIVAFKQVGREFVRATPTIDVNIGNPGTSAVTATLSVPVDIVVDAILTSLHYDGSPSSGSHLVLFSTDQSLTAGSGTLTSLQPATSGTAAAQSLFTKIKTNTSAQIKYDMDYSDAGIIVRLITRGWVDTTMKRLGG